MKGTMGGRTYCEDENKNNSSSLCNIEEWYLGKLIGRNDTFRYPAIEETEKQQKGEGGYLKT
jgi:hypothetical protein